MKYNLAVLGLALGLAGCSSDDGLLADPSPTSEGEAIVLDVKEVVSPVTRAEQQKGSMDFATLTSTGFGVYGYKGTYNSTSSQPTLFSSSATNTPVTFIAGGTAPTTTLVHPGNWTYTSTNDWKLWEKNGDDEEEYTFFAYAPYMASDGTAPGITTIKGTSDITAGDPTIGYTVAEDPANSVDLLWGIRSDNGLPWKDIQRSQTAGAVLFTFYHALCGIGYHAQVIVDKDNNLSDLEDASGIGAIGKADGCKVTLKSITLTPAGKPAENETQAVAAVPFHQSGVLNLNNTTAHQPLWSNTSGTIASLIVNGEKLKVALRDPNPDYEDNDTGKKVMTDEAYDTEVTGVTEAANSQTIITGDNMFMLIPQDAQDYTVTVEYFLTYKTGSGYRRESRTGTATLSNLELKAGVKYYINLVFGLTTFKLNVQAKDWEGSVTNTTIITEKGTSASQSLAK